MKEISVQTHSRFEMIDITAAVQKAVNEEKIESGICLIYTPHTTAAVTINENADPDVPRDILAALDKAIPLNANYRHMEGNSAAHVKSSLVGASELVIIEKAVLFWEHGSQYFSANSTPAHKKSFYLNCCRLMFILL